MDDRSVTRDEMFAEQKKTISDGNPPTFVTMDEVKRQAGMPFTRQRFVNSAKGPMVFTEELYTCEGCHDHIPFTPHQQKPKRCGGCHQVFYCDTTCQRKDWSRHKQTCAALLVDKRKARALRKKASVGEAMEKKLVGQAIKRLSGGGAVTTATTTTSISVAAFPTATACVMVAIDPPIMSGDDDSEGLPELSDTDDSEDLPGLASDAQEVPRWQRDVNLAKYLDELSGAADLASNAAITKAFEAVEDAKSKLNAAKIAKHWARLAYERAAESASDEQNCQAASRGSFPNDPDWLD
jgi:hypothetical protein